MTFFNLRHYVVPVLLLIQAGCASLPQQEKAVPQPESAIANSSSAQPNHAEKSIEDPGFIGLHDHILKLAKLKPSTNLWDHIRKDFSLPKFESARVTFYEKQFTRRPESFARVLERGKWFLPTIYAKTKELGYPSELALLPAIESAYKTDALSRTGASGLWQFIRSTGRLFGMQQNWWYDGRRDPMRSTDAALKYLAQLNKRFDGDWLLAIAGYNAGGRTIEREVEKNQRAKRPTGFQHLKLRKETRDYIPKLIAWRNIVADPEKFGVKLPRFPLAPQFAQIDAGSQINISLLTKLLDADPKAIRFLNSAYKRGVTPPDGPHWVYVPAKHQKRAISQLAKLDKKDRMMWTHHRVQKGEVLGRISNRYNVSVAVIKQHNKLRNNLIHPGDILLIPAIGASQTTAGTKVASRAKKRNNTLTHSISRGDTLWEIAKRYGVKVADLTRWNSIRPSQTLKLGNKLVIYTKRS